MTESELKELSKNASVVMCKPDKDRGVVNIDKAIYSLHSFNF